MKSTKSLKISKLTKTQYHNDVVPAFVAYRKKMAKECGISTDDYLRIFTEKRTNGARSKFWYTRNSLATNKVESYITKNPTFESAEGRVFEVTARWVANNPYYNFGNYAIFCKLVK